MQEGKLLGTKESHDVTEKWGRDISMEGNRDGMTGAHWSI